MRLVPPDDPPRLVPLFETFYGANFGEAVRAAAVARRLHQAEGHETVVVAEVGDRLTGFASLRVTDSLDPAPTRSSRNCSRKPSPVGSASRRDS